MICKYSDKYTKIGAKMGICLGNNQGNFQLHGFTTHENIAKSFKGATFFDSHCIPVCAITHTNSTAGFRVRNN